MRKNKWIEFDLLKKHTSVCSKSYLRHGGFSKKPYDSLNLGTSVGDNYENVKKNRELIKNELNAGKIIFANQVHGKEIVEITKKNVDEAFNVDGFYTKEKNIALAILHADCQAALFFDPIQKIIGAVHAGWRGLMLNFYKEMIDIFIKKENSNHKNILVCIAPSICHKHSEFINYKNEIDKKYHSFQIKKKYFDLKKIARFQLQNEGILDENIEISNECSFCNEKDFFSFRRDKITGRNASCILMRE